eukprot:1611101-Amphidinium_carterae.1
MIQESLQRKSSPSSPKHKEWNVCVGVSEGFTPIVQLATKASVDLVWNMRHNKMSAAYTMLVSMIPRMLGLHRRFKCANVYTEKRGETLCSA